MVAEEKKEATDAEVAERIGSVAPKEGTAAAEDAGEKRPEDGEEPEDKGEGSEGDEPKDKPAAERGESDDEPGESEDEPEEGDEDEDEEDEGGEPEDVTGKQRTVPYAKLKSERGKRKALEDSIQDLVTAISKARGEPDKEEDLDDLSKEAKRLGEELGQDPEGLAKVLRSAVELAKKEFGGKLPKEVEDKLKLLDELTERDKQVKEATHFEKEWGPVVTALKAKFPSATESMLTEAKKAMDELAHTKKYHRFDLDYILFKEGKKFETILKAAPGNKSGESGKTIASKESDGDAPAEDSVKIEDMTPDVMKRREQRDISERSAQDDDPGVQIIEPITE